MAKWRVIYEEERGGPDRTGHEDIEADLFKFVDDGWIRFEASNGVVVQIRADAVQRIQRQKATT